ncbi:MAG: radical SAM family heme chaperone HemW [Eubacterium sp.]|nr:radical SAM family heme chaperone HemW [Eubacterium sp.]MCM1216262.1 radical SAM family heme chaperone HemW [Lachnospiraceae bacterium]MCM1304943.1 radical SAM family heme chaperone HemW [Butyrivibrio sp.]MCM1343359.1 radical SAM family heme chaperone HemW [Muribaculaceae bacterium]MCM1238880.1 radical SAM family heme chaperone HemW [Lachnospiraceae bacterium]
MTDKRELELYFHIPFCVRKCLYCDFLSAPGDGKTKARYMEALIRETKERAGDYRDYRVVSVFIGGGTPSIVSPEKICVLLETVRAGYDLAEDAEITIEVNPGTVDEKTLHSYRQWGINRLSIGLQSTDDRELAALGRIHTYGQFLGIYHTARKCGFSNINVDLMSALPGQTLRSYLTTLEKILALDPAPEHISAYSLILEEGTPFYEMARRGELQLPDEECDRLMYEKTEELLAQAGYRRYEISNYARPGYECRHNCGYWRRREYLGLGAGAASLIGNRRFRNTDSLEAYLADPLDVREDIQELTIKEQMEEFMFLGLRMTEGISIPGFQKNFGQAIEEVYAPVIEKNIKDGLLEYRNKTTPKDPARLALTKRGLDLSNMVMSQFLF